jgi:hypothetical protein
MLPSAFFIDVDAGSSFENASAPRQLMEGKMSVRVGFFLFTAIAISSPAWAQPAGLAAGCQGAWQRYQMATGRPKAFALAPDKACGWWQNNDAARTLEEVRNKAVNQCRTMGGNEACRLVDVQR